ncbi:flotillin family protein [Paenalkalicoccus suaedae]|uniref:Flotillin family protein n=1 Tax=Paenalkalicoccus suaedae TaxID=2592382 RepID=A0A859FHU0_9BACI|nr:flotillin family protein [Paenalkalicoccus suaedae]QKS72408.1 flotillin family protein [Paenalkalicoccus suaedae]
MEAIIIVGIVVGVVFLMLLGVYFTRYQTSGPNEALIVTGSYLGKGKNISEDSEGKKMKIIRGGGAFVVPVFQQYAKFSLANYSLDVRTSGAYTEQGVPVSVDGVAIVKVGSTMEEVATAAEQYLGKNTAEFEEEVQDVLRGHLRSILGSMSVEDINNNRERFNQEVQSVASRDFNKMGLEIKSFTLQEVTDAQGYLDSLGKPRIAEIKRNAAIAEAERKKEARIENARAEQEAKAQELIRDTEIANSEKERELKIAQYKREQDQAKAEADQAYELQAAKSKQMVTSEQMQIQIIERDRQIELEEREIVRREKQYDAEVRKKADADRYEQEQRAEATKVQQMRAAEASQYQIEAEAKANADAERYRGESEASVIRNRGLAEAEVIRQKGEAEAEAKMKLAEAYEHYGEAAKLAMILDMLPAYAKEISAPLSAIDKVTVVDTGGSGNGKNGGAGKMSSYVTDLMATLPENLKAASGIDVQGLLENLSGAPEKKAVKVSDDEEAGSSAEETTSTEESVKEEAR